MYISRTSLITSYLVIGFLAFIGTWSQFVGMVGQFGFLDATLRFWQDLMVNAASRFITIDILFFGLAIVIWMILEARRLQIPGVWLYIAAALLIGVRLFIPLFLVHRERRLAALEGGSLAGAMKPLDLTGIALVAGGFITFCGYMLMHSGA